MNFTKFLRTLFLKEHRRWLLLESIDDNLVIELIENQKQAEGRYPGVCVFHIGLLEDCVAKGVNLQECQLKK